MKNKADTELVALARSGDKEAFSQLIERYQLMAKRISLGMIAREDIARELVQEAILEAYLSLDHLRDNARFKSWFYGIVLNVCRSYIREQKTDTFSLEVMMGGVHCDALAFPSAALDPQEVAEQRELHSIVLKAIQDLSPKDRLATLLFYYEQLSLREIAAILGVSVVAVKGRLYRAREQLREQLLSVYPDMKYATSREKGRKSMTKVTVAAVLERPDEKKGHVVVLLDEIGQRVLNIWIGPAEALTIGMGITEVSAPRPMTAHFMVNLLRATDMKLEEVRVETLKDDVFYAVARFRQGDALHELDARPSDAIALAVLMQSPIYVAEEILQRDGIALPKGKTVQIGTVRDAVLKQVEETFQGIKSLSLTPEECEQANQKFVAYLIGEGA
jgi:RNA polymerase sigma factor (sigma-70 family)